MNVHALELTCIEVCESYRYCTWYEITGRPCLMLDPFTEIPNILRRKVWGGPTCFVWGTAWGLSGLGKAIEIE